MMDKILDSTIGALNTSLNLRQLNQNLIGSNIANSDTPGYKTKTLDFERELRRNLGTEHVVQLEADHSEHLRPTEEAAVNPEVYDDPNGIESLDGNTVDRSLEMSRMAENQILYNTSIELMKRKLGMLKYGITEGGGNR